MTQQPTVHLSVRELVELIHRSGSIDNRFGGFDRANEGSRLHRKLQKEAKGDYRAEVVLKGRFVVEDVCYELDGRADGIFTENGETVIDEIKTTCAPAELLTADFNAAHWAQVQCYGAFLCEEQRLSHVTLQLTYVQADTEEIIRHRKRFSKEELEQFVRGTLLLYAPWQERRSRWLSVRTESLAALKFPFPHYRTGQYELAGSVYRTIRRGSQLFAVAPTGTGKTLSTLFPALKAMGAGTGTAVFYLTAKNATREAAQGALGLLRDAMASTDTPLRLKSVVLTAKEKICPMERVSCNPIDCPRADGYYDRINDALLRFLDDADDFSPAAICAFAQKEQLCPFELALDLSSHCDCILCDYNYVFDPVVRLKRFFAQSGENKEYILLVDEAHNLVDRSREMYSGHLYKTAFWEVKKAVGKQSRRLSSALTKLNRRMIDFRTQSESAACSAWCTQEPDKPLLKAVGEFCAAAEIFLQEHRNSSSYDAVLSLYFDARFFLKLHEWYDDHFTTLISVEKNEVAVSCLCLDASDFLAQTFSSACSAVLFSATLSPLDYFMRTLGALGDARGLMMASPFQTKHLCLLCADKISTKYADREQSLHEVCGMIHAAVSARAGNYLVFAPSYRYLRQIYEAFQLEYPEHTTLMQEPSLSPEQQADFLNQFQAKDAAGLVGFCVLGGSFSEGIDLAGERLIGCIIIGVGLPQVGAVPDALRDYYNEQGLDGFAYAYRCPGMNKVLQAAGRVIRTEQDRGMVLLIDTRYRQSAYRALMPPHWNHLRYFSDAQELTEALNAFWTPESDF